MSVVKIPYRPRELQLKLHREARRFNVLCCHRRFGKTVWGVNHLLKGAIEALSEGKERPRVGYIAPLYSQAKRIAWDYVLHYTGSIPGRAVNQNELRVDFLDGCRIQLFGADNPDSLRGMYFDGVVLDEYAQMSSRVWNEIIRPALVDRRGWAVFIGTPQGRNQFWKIYNEARSAMRDGDVEWFARTYKASQTGLIPEDELEAARRTMTPEEYAQEFECSWTAAVRGAYYGDLMQEAEKDRIGAVPYEPVLPVHTAWDLGMDDATAIWFFQRHGREIRLIEYFEGSGHGLDFYVRYLQRQGYVYGDHWFPHDVKVRELGTGKSRMETLRSLGLRVRVVPMHAVEDGIQAVRNILPRCWFDEQKCSRGIEALRLYRTEWDDKREVFRQKPRHDWTSHAADAFRYLAMGIYDRVDGVRPAFALQEGTYDDYDPLGYSPRYTYVD